MSVVNFFVCIFIAEQPYPRALIEVLFHCLPNETKGVYVFSLTCFFITPTRCLCPRIYLACNDSL